MCDRHGNVTDLSIRTFYCDFCTMLSRSQWSTTSFPSIFHGNASRVHVFGYITNFMSMVANVNTRRISACWPRPRLVSFNSIQILSVFCDQVPRVHSNGEKKATVPTSMEIHMMHHRVPWFSIPMVKYQWSNTLIPERPHSRGERDPHYSVYTEYFDIDGLNESSRTSVRLSISRK